MTALRLSDVAGGTGLELLRDAEFENLDRR